MILPLNSISNKVESRYLTAVAELLKWEPLEGLDEHNICHVPLLPRKKLRDGVDLIVCHDMQGGYVEDDIYPGGYYSDKVDFERTAYTVKNWNHISIYVYFSHHFLTIPPVVWTSCAHKNGVQCLGTIIVEHEAGTEQILRLIYGDTFGGNETVCAETAAKLVQIAQYFRFDGYLVNVESPIESRHVDKLLQWLTILKNLLHQANPSFKLIWYDSIIHDGSLHWQDCLNENNLKFFQVSDAFFTNYTWRQKQLEISQKSACERVKDVYVGVDVWGRGQLGGGQLNCHLDFDLIKKYGLNAALFAPAWSFEGKSRLNYYKLDNMLWNDDYCGISQYLSLYSTPVVDNSFETDFCMGYGNYMFQNGKLMHSGFYSHISKQSYLPNLCNSNRFYDIKGADRLNLELFEWRLTNAQDGIGIEPYSGSHALSILCNAVNVPREIMISPLFRFEGIKLENGVVITQVIGKLDAFSLYCKYRVGEEELMVMCYADQTLNSSLESQKGWQALEYQLPLQIQVIEVGIAVNGEILKHQGNNDRLIGIIGKIQIRESK
ncbi:hypothetical protein MIR68_004001 [Amoeboaphelidium protococcarum]|nr:hypothetical protein MIR68_004001 [Amoeboaphelidium protococcarum]